jgi:hypothetical protein
MCFIRRWARRAGTVSKNTSIRVEGVEVGGRGSEAPNSGLGYMSDIQARKISCHRERWRHDKEVTVLVARMSLEGVDRMHYFLGRRR